MSETRPMQLRRPCLTFFLFCSAYAAAIPEHVSRPSFERFLKEEDIVIDKPSKEKIKPKKPKVSVLTTLLWRISIQKYVSQCELNDLENYFIVILGTLPLKIFRTDSIKAVHM